MSTASRICIAIGAFLAIAGVVYGLTSGELAGTTSLLVTAVTLGGLSLVFRSVARQQEAGAEEPTEVHVAPTIWPFGFAIAAVLLVIGLIVSPWILILGGVAFAGCVGGWLRDVARSRDHAGGT